MRLVRRPIFVGMLVCVAVTYVLLTVILLSREPVRINHTMLELASEELRYKHDEPSFIPVVVVGYMRSGSTLTGNLIQQDPDVFYVFEPLHDIVYEYEREKQNQFPNLKFKTIRTSMMLKEAVLQLFRAWFACDLDYILDGQSRFHVGFLKYGLKTNTLLECLSEKIHPIRNRMLCTDMLISKCLQSTFKVLKTIRTPLHWLYELMEELPNMKIVHLVRDPRAIITSQRLFGECTVAHGGVAGCSQILCSRIEDDLTTFEMFSKLYPDRVLRLKFEDLASRPITKTKEIYEYLDLNFTRRTQEYIVNITMSGNNASFVLDTVKPDSRDMIDQWRERISDGDLLTVQTMCKYVMQKLSYHHFIKPL